MRRSQRQTVRGAVVEAAAGRDLVVAVADAAETIIRDTHASRANRAGSFLVFGRQLDAWVCDLATQAIKPRRNCECHEEDRLLLNARRNKRDNKNSATRRSAGSSASRTSQRVRLST